MAVWGVPTPAVIIVTYNSARYIGDCLSSLTACEGRPQIVVVDNASTDETLEIVDGHASATLIRNKCNLGFAAAVNLGVEATQGDPIILLNPDTLVSPGYLEAMNKAVESPSVAIAGCKILEPDGKTLQHVGGRMGTNALTQHIGRGELDCGQYDEVTQVDYVTGAGLAIRREVWALLGGLDEGYWPAYFEDAELCWCARGRGYNVVIEPAAVLRHYERGSSRSSREASEELSSDYLTAYHRNRIRFASRNFTLSHLIKRFVPAETCWLLSRKRREERRALLRAYLWAVAKLPSTVTFRVRRSPGLT
jgi:GT2 family glycosyltransferase